MHTRLTADLGRFVSGLKYSDLPAEVVAQIKMAFTDCICCTIAGARDPAPQLLKTMLAPTGDEATLLVGTGRASALDAAWINGTAAHALDYDDVTQRGGHPSAYLMPAILAEAEVLGSSGEEMIAAYAAGYETFADLVRRDANEHHEKGWHPTGIFGPIGAAAACASLRRLDADKATIAIALSTSRSSGLISNFGTMTKPFHAGSGAHSGVAAARLAELGFTAAKDAIEHGFLNAVSLAGRVDLDTPTKVGTEWQICGANRLGIKKYPLCYCTHRAVDGMLGLARKHSIDPQGIEKITVSMSPRNVTILRNHLPQTGLEAKFSIEFALAAPLIAGNAGLAELTDAFVRKSELQTLMKRVAIEEDPRPDPKRSGFSIHDRIVVQMRGGDVLDSGPISHVRGDPDHPLTADELWTKFEDCLRSAESRVPARQLFDMLMGLEREPDTRAIINLLTARPEVVHSTTAARKSA